MTDDDISEVETKLKTFWPYESSDNGDEDVASTLINREWHNHALPCLRTLALKQGHSSQQYQIDLVQAHRISEVLFNALHQTGKFEPDYRKPRYVWMHQAVDIFKANDAKRGFEIDKSELSQVAAEYLSHPEIRTNMLDWQLLDSIIFQELDAYAYNALHTRGGTGVNLAASFAGGNPAKYYGLQFVFGIVGFVFAYLAFPALAVFLLIREHEIWAVVIAGLWALNLVFKMISFPARRRARKKAAELLQNLVDLYGVLGNSTISPRKLKESLDSAAAAGVVLDGAVFTLVDRMIARDPTAFIPTQ